MKIKKVNTKKEKTEEQEDKFSAKSIEKSKDDNDYKKKS